MRNITRWFTLNTIIGCSLAGSIHANQCTLTIDKYYSPYMGSNIMLTALTGYEAADDILFSSTAGDRSPLVGFGRIAKWGVEFSLANLGMVIQHEVFGHGARGREFKLSNLSYDINVFSGSTTYKLSTFQNLDLNAKAAYSAGGVEATSILAQQLERNFILDGAIDSRAATLYLVNAMDQSIYALNYSTDRFHPDEDQNNYINYVNQWQQKTALRKTNFKTRLLWDWLNPMFYMSGYTIINYLITGDQSAQIYALKWGDSRFMPTTRILLAPWGPEYQVQGHFVNPDDRYFGLYLRYGKTGGKNSYGIDLQFNPLRKTECWSVSNKFAAWHQPHVLKGVSGRQNHSKYGAGNFLALYYKLHKGVYALGEIGYKFSGYLPGYPLARGTIWRVGFKVELDIKQAKLHDVELKI